MTSASGLLRPPSGKKGKLTRGIQSCADILRAESDQAVSYSPGDNSEMSANASRRSREGRQFSALETASNPANAQIPSPRTAMIYASPLLVDRI